MKKTVLLILFSTLLLFGTEPHTLKAEYAISYAIFGKIGKAEARLRIENNRYHIEIRAEATGIAKLMSNQRIEQYSSSGIVVNKRLEPEHFIVKTRKGKYFKEEHHFFFNHLQKRVKHITYITTKEERKEKEELLSYYARDDILTLFFNLRFYLHDRCKTGKCTLVAAGANEKDGRVDIISLGRNRFKVILHRRIFASKQGEMEIHINEMGICDFALLKDVVFFGDVKANTTKISYPKREVEQ
jgi:hypothetical protein